MKIEDEKGLRGASSAAHEDIHDKLQLAKVDTDGDMAERTIVDDLEKQACAYCLFPVIISGI